MRKLFWSASYFAWFDPTVELLQHELLKQLMFAIIEKCQNTSALQHAVYHTVAYMYKYTTSQTPSHIYLMYS